MPPIDEHCISSRERTGKDYREVHEWIDGNESKKVERHDITKIPENFEEVKAKWREEGAKEFIYHLKDDIERRIGKTMQYFGLFKEPK